MYLSRVEIDKNNRRNLKKLDHLGAYHDWVEKSFPSEFDSEERTRKLWRIDKLNNKEYLLIVSVEKPDLEKLEKFGVKNTAKSKRYDDFIEKLNNGQRMRFKVTLNPVIAKHKKGSKDERGIVYPHVTVSQKTNFLLERSLKNGFELKTDEFLVTETSFELLRRAKGKNVRVSKATYEGVLTIKDIDLFRDILINGFGKKKAFGCGMMTVIPMV